MSRRGKPRPAAVVPTPDEGSPGPAPSDSTPVTQAPGPTDVVVDAQLFMSQVNMLSLAMNCFSAPVCTAVLFEMEKLLKQQRLLPQPLPIEQQANLGNNIRLVRAVRDFRARLDNLASEPVLSDGPSPAQILHLPGPRRVQ